MSFEISVSSFVPEYLLILLDLPKCMQKIICQN